MTIRNDDEFKSALKWRFTMGKTGNITTVALTPFAVFNVGGQPGGGSMTLANTANGVVHTKAVAGYPTFPDAVATKGWYLALSDGQSSAACRRDYYDYVYSAGSYAFNANQAVTAQPSIDDRLRVAPPWGGSAVVRAGDIVTNGAAPIKCYLCTVGGTTAASGGPTTTAASITDGTATWQYLGNGLNYGGLELWYEQVTAGTGVQSVAVTYSTMADDGVTLTAGRTTGTVVMPAAMIANRMQRLPLQAGDKNVALITNVVGTVATAGTFNIHLARRLDSHVAGVSPFTDIHGYDRTGLPYIPNNAAIREVQVTAGTTSVNLAVDLVLALG